MSSDLRVLLAEPPVTDLADYTSRRGGGSALARARELGPGGTIQEVALSGLRGRGGGGYSTGQKWSGLVSDTTGAGDRYVVANGADGEPGTFKDRAIMRADPYQVIEGLAIAAFAVGAAGAYLCVKEKYTGEVASLRRAIEEMTTAGLAGDVPITLVTGPEHYLFGEEKAMLQVIEGDAPLPRLFPPYVHGLFATGPQMGWSARPGSGHQSGEASNPTLVNNVETLATVTHILSNGPEWHRALGTAASPGFTVVTVVGDVVRPGVAEVELGTPLRRVIDQIGGGVAEGRAIRAVFSGVANGVLRADDLDAPMSYEGLETVGGGLGSAGFIVYDDTADLVTVARMMSRFLYVESCGQCPACKFGTGEITASLERIDAGTGTDADIATISARLQTVTDANRCYLPVEEQILISSILRRFPEDVAIALEGGPRFDRRYPFPLIADLQDGVVEYDPSPGRKQPDWTYVDAPGGTA